MKIYLDGELHFGQTSMIIRQIAGACPTLFKNHFGDQLLVVRLERSDDDLLQRSKLALKGNRPLVAPRQVGNAVLIPALGVDLFITRLTRLDELYVVPADWAGSTDDLPSFLPDVHSFEHGAPEGFLDSFRKLGARRFFADGLGTNFCVSSMPDASGIEQAESTVGPKWV